MTASDNTGKITCSNCGAENVPDWDGKGHCITCARDLVLGADNSTDELDMAKRLMEWNSERFGEPTTLEYLRYYKSGVIKERHIEAVIQARYTPKPEAERQVLLGRIDLINAYIQISENEEDKKMIGHFRTDLEYYTNLKSQLESTSHKSEGGAG